VVVGDRQISINLKEVCVTLAYMYGLETTALTEIIGEGAGLQKQMVKENCAGEEKNG